MWAPAASSLAVRVNGRDHALERERRRVLARRSATAGTATTTSTSSTARSVADPASRWQPDGVRGPSRVLDTSRFEWNDTSWPGLALDELVLYELHVGTFSEEGTFDGAIRHLARAARARRHRDRGDADRDVPRHARLGLRRPLHLGAAPGVRRAGGVCALRRRGARRAGSASSSTSSTTTSARARGARARSARTSPTATRRSGATRSTTAQRGVREWAIQNAELWVRDYQRRRSAARRGARGLRRRAARTSSPSSPSACARSSRARSSSPRWTTGDLRPIEEWGHDAQWADELHHELHVLLTGERDGLLRRLRLARRARRAELRREPAERLVVCVAEPRPGRQPRRRRPAGGATSCRLARRRRPLRAADAAAVHGRGVRRARARSSSSPTTSTRRSPTRRARVAGASSQASPGSRPRTCPTRRRSRRSSARSSTAPWPTRSCARSTASCSRCAASCRARSSVDVDGSRPARAARAGRARRRLRREDRGAPAMRRLARRAVPARRDVGRRRHELLALLRERRARRALPLRRRRRRDAGRAERAHGVQLARLPAGRRARAALRLPRPRPVRPRARAPLQPGEAADRPVREGDRGPGRLRRARTRCRTCPTRATDADLGIDDEDDAAAIPKCVVVDPASTGRATARRERRGTRRSSTRCTSRASRSSTRTCARTCAAPTRASRARRRSSTSRRSA